LPIKHSDLKRCSARRLPDTSQVRSKPLGFFISRVVNAGQNILQVRPFLPALGQVSKNGKALPSCRFINSCPASLCLHR